MEHQHKDNFSESRCISNTTVQNSKKGTKEFEDNRDLSLSRKILKVPSLTIIQCGKFPIDPTPDRVGKEIELHHITLKWKRNKKDSFTNNTLLANTKTGTFGQTESEDLPIIKIEVEGVERGTPSIELIFGPLTIKEQSAPNLKKAQAHLLETFNKSGDLDGLLAEYNAKVIPDYRLTPTSVGKEVLVQFRRKQNLYTQSNVAVPFDQIGRKGAIDGFFSSDSPAQHDAYIFAQHFSQSYFSSFSPMLLSFFTMFLYNAYLFSFVSEIKKGQISLSTNAKQHFHLMPKFSTADMVISILPYQDILFLTKWLINAPMIENLKTTFCKYDTMKTKDLIAAFDYSINNLKEVLQVRLKLLTPEPIPKVENSTNKKSLVSLVDGMKVTHMMPRANARLPIRYSSTGMPYVVLEVRKREHSFNTDVAYHGPYLKVPYSRVLKKTLPSIDVPTYSDFTVLAKPNKDTTYKDVKAQSEHLTSGSQDERLLTQVAIRSIIELLNPDVHQLVMNQGMTYVEGGNWMCYVRCVLTALGAMQHFDTIEQQIRAIDPQILRAGIEVGSETERNIQHLIKKINGNSFFVVVINADNTGGGYSAIQEGVGILLLHTGAHFSLVNGDNSKLIQTMLKRFQADEAPPDAHE